MEIFELYNITNSSLRDSVMIEVEYHEVELFLFRRRCASVELSTGSSCADGGWERASNVAFMAPWGREREREGEGRREWEGEGERERERERESEGENGRGRGRERERGRGKSKVERWERG